MKLRIKRVNQLTFMPLLFDTLFGLILFFSLDLFFKMQDITHFLFYIFTLVVLIHWWLIFKSDDDIFGNEVRNSAFYLVFGIIYIILLDYNISFAREFNYIGSTISLMILLMLDFLWALIRRFIGKWKTDNKYKIRMMREALNYSLFINPIIIFLFLILCASYNYIDNIYFIFGYFLIYMCFILLTFTTKIIDIDLY